MAKKEREEGENKTKEVIEEEMIRFYTMGGKEVNVLYETLIRIIVAIFLIYALAMSGELVIEISKKIIPTILTIAILIYGIMLPIVRLVTTGVYHRYYEVPISKIQQEERQWEEVIEDIKEIFKIPKKRTSLRLRK